MLVGKNLVAAAMGAALCSLSATASVVTQTQSIGSFNFTGMPAFQALQFPAFNKFDPASGTLNSVDFSASITGTVTTGTVDGFLFLYGPVDADGTRNGGTTLFTDAINDSTSAGPVSKSYQDTGFPASVARFLVGSGTEPFSFEPEFLGDGGTFSLNTVSLTVTYEFTPAAAAVPEPASVLLAATALLGLVVVRRRT